jgi:hypothetical protein
MRTQVIFREIGRYSRSLLRPIHCATRSGRYARLIEPRFCCEARNGIFAFTTPPPPVEGVAARQARSQGPPFSWGQQPHDLERLGPEAVPLRPKDHSSSNFELVSRHSRALPVNHVVVVSDLNLIYDKGSPPVQVSSQTWPNFKPAAGIAGPSSLLAPLRQPSHQGRSAGKKLVLCRSRILVSGALAAAEGRCRRLGQVKRVQVA